MSIYVTMIWLANLVFDTAGHLAFKAASKNADQHDGLKHWRALFGGPLLWLGIAAFVIEFFLWLALLTMAPLSQGIMIGCVNIIGVMVGGWLVFGEPITPPRTAAASFIALGVLLVGWGGA